MDDSPRTPSRASATTAPTTSLGDTACHPLLDQISLRDYQPAQAEIYQALGLDPAGGRPPPVFEQPVIAKEAPGVSGWRQPQFEQCRR